MLDVVIHYRRGAFDLEVAFCAPTPGVIALFGRSGAGKSTVINLLAGLLTLRDGHIVLDNEPLADTARDIQLPAEQRGVGYVFQDGRLFPHLDVANNLRYGLRRSQRPVRTEYHKVVELLGLGELTARRPHQLSGGERQRVALGRALLAQPRMLLLDEPLASLDLARRAELLPYLERLRDEARIPIVYVSHQFEEIVRLATSVVVLDRGRVAAAGDLTTVALNPALRSIAGAEAVGAILRGQVARVDLGAGLAFVAIGAQQLAIENDGLARGDSVRLQLLARDLVLAATKPAGLSVRGVLQGRISALQADGERAVLVEITVEGHALLARVTAGAAHDLQLQVGCPLWVLVKAVSLRGHVFPDAVS